MATSARFWRIGLHDLLSVVGLVHGIDGAKVRPRIVGTGDSSRWRRLSAAATAKRARAVDRTAVDLNGFDFRQCVKVETE